MAMKSQKPKEIEQARDFAISQRGQLILAQALAVASKVLKKREPSNARDMDYLGQSLFQPFWSLYADENISKMVKQMQKHIDEDNHAKSI